MTSCAAGGGHCETVTDPDGSWGVECLGGGDPVHNCDCEGVDCPVGQMCVNGDCVGAPPDPCDGVICPGTDVCENGACVPDPDAPTDTDSDSDTDTDTDSDMDMDTDTDTDVDTDTDTDSDMG